MVTCTVLAVRYHDFCAGHRVFGHESKCALVHGHNYRAVFYCEAPELDALGRVIDFSEIKHRLCTWLEENWDHRFLVWEQDPLVHTDLPGIVAVPFNPTAENMASYLLKHVGPAVFTGLPIRLVEVELWETRKCSVRARLQ